MLGRSSFEYAVVRVVPRVEREEFVNAGVIVYSRTHDFLEARVEVVPARLRALDPDVDLELVRSHLGTLARVAAADPGAGPIARLPLADRFHWLVAPRSTIIQISPVHSGLCEDPGASLAHLFEQVVR